MSGDPYNGSKVWKAPDREISKPRENHGKVIAHRDLQPTAAFHDRENRRNLRSRLWAADVQPILSTKSYRTLAAYDTDIFIVGCGQSIPLCRRGLGYDAAGLDYLIGKRTRYYVRRQRDRTLMKGDRVAVLGRGIAVVEQADSKWIHAVVWNKCELRIARKEIGWDERNMRWETNPHACVEANGKA